PEACKDEDLPQLCFVVPKWNEDIVIESKWDDLVSQRYPESKRRLMLIDSASTDQTVSIATKWNDTHGHDLQIVQMPARLGKSAAINRAMQELIESDDVFVMTDAEATLEDGALRRIGRWMKDPSIGAVCGTLTDTTEDSTYRGWYRWFRSGESRADSTPIFEGSIAAYRISALHPVEPSANADDSQLAVLVRNEGLRAISDESIRFSEAPITDAREYHDRSVRRGQGLSRHFWRQRYHWFRNGRWGTILGLNGLQHSISPWFVLIGILAGFAHASTVLLIGWFGGEPMFLDRAMLLVDALVLASLGLGITGLRIPLCASAVAFLIQNLRLVQVMILLQFGRSLHQWDASKSNRPRN
ncbi:MAG: glycosyltransferase, partial [Candidatus Thermoplasmatota archaeon]|nr:glycosyltransferase [Candidatus Thermoplasmatota archaeon]